MSAAPIMRLSVSAGSQFYLAGRSAEIARRARTQDDYLAGLLGSSSTAWLAGWLAREGSAAGRAQASALSELMQHHGAALSHTA